MSMAEFQEWQAYHKKYLFPLERNEIQTAQILTALAFVFKSKKKVNDFLIRLKQRTKQSVTNLEESVKNIFRGMA